MKSSEFNSNNATSVLYFKIEHEKGVPIPPARLVIRRIIYSLSDNKCFHIEHLPIRQEQSYGIAAACKSLNVYRNVCLSVTYRGCFHYNTCGTYDLNQSIAYVFGKPVSDIYSVISRIRRKGNKHASTYCHAYSIIILCSVSLCNHFQFILLQHHRLNCQIHACSDRITVYIISCISCRFVYVYSRKTYRLRHKNGGIVQCQSLEVSIHVFDCLIVFSAYDLEFLIPMIQSNIEIEYAILRNALSKETNIRSAKIKRRNNLVERCSVKFFHRFVILFEGKGEIIRKR